MKNSMSIGCSPSFEDCVQVGSPNYYERARKECRAFKNQLQRVFGDPPPGAYFKTVSSPHDFGDYLEVHVVFDDSDEEAMEFACKVENEMPEYWDVEALAELNGEAKTREVAV